jgi:AraC-like DNA-binding protein
MTFLVTNQEGRSIAQQETTDAALFPHLLRGASRMLLKDDQAMMFFQQLELNSCSLSYSIFRMQENGYYHFKSDEPMLDIHIVLENTLSFEHTNTGQYSIDKNQFNLRYQPNFNNMIYFEKGDTIVLSVNYSVDYLRRYFGFFQPMERFLKCVTQKQAINLSPDYLAMSMEMNHIVFDLIHHDEAGKIRELLLSSKALELLNLSISQMGLNDELLILSVSEIDKMVKAKHLLEQRMENPPGLLELARLLGTNDCTLKRSFKQYHGCTIYEYVLQYRMESAINMLQHSETAITEIAYATGYHSIYAFSKAFKKYFGYPPSQGRMRA